MTLLAAQLLATAQSRLDRFGHGVWYGFKVFVLAAWHIIVRNNHSDVFHVGAIVGMALFLALIALLINRASH